MKGGCCGIVTGIFESSHSPFCATCAVRSIEYDAEFAHQLLGDLFGGRNFAIIQEARDVSVVILDRLHTAPLFDLDVFEELGLEVFEV